MKKHPKPVDVGLNLARLMGAMSLLLGAVVLLGWYLHEPALIQVNPAFVPMQYNTALGFAVGGLALLGLAGVRVAQKDFDSAREMYRRLADLKPDSAEVLFNAGLLEQKAENHERAAELYAQAISKKADLAEAHLNLAVALQSTGNEEKAVASFEEAIRLKPQLAKGYFSLKPMSRSLARPTRS